MNAVNISSPPSIETPNGISEGAVGAEGASVVEGTQEGQQPAQEAQRSYFTWKKNAPQLYTLLITATLAWPSMTVQWLPEVTKDKVSSQSLLLGTRTSGQSSEYLQLAKVSLPAPTITSLDKYDPERNTIGEHTTKTAAGFNIYQRIDHFGEVNKARYMPQNPNVVASMSSTGNVYVFDVTHFARTPSGSFGPDISLVGHKAEGYGLAWSGVSEGLLATGASDGQLLLWDTQGYNSQTGVLEPIYRHEFTTAVNAVSTHIKNPAIVAAVTDDAVAIVDQRVRSSSVIAGNGGLSVAYNPVNEFLAAVGTEKGEVQLWDLRNAATMVHSLNSHTDGVVALDWNRNYPGTLLSGSQDSTVIVWNVGKLEASFCHRGHTKGVDDVSWNPANNSIASVSADNTLHIWTPYLG